jgi:hypothetical protein
MDKEIIRLYKKAYLSGPNIGKKLGIHSKKVYKVLKANGVKCRPAAVQNEIRFRRTPLSFDFKEARTKKENDLLIAAAMIYLGEGAKTGVTVDVANSDIMVHKVFLQFLRKICRVKEKKLRFYLYCFENQDQNKLIDMWASALNVRKEAFTKPYIRKNTTGNKSQRKPYGVLHTRYNDKRLLEKILSLCSNLVADLSA